MSKYIDTAVNDELARVRDASEGGRNNACNKAAYHLGRLVEAGDLDPDEIVELLLEAAYVSHSTSAEDAKPALKVELRATIESGLRAGQKNPKIVDADFVDREQGMAEVEDEVMDHQEEFLAVPRKGHRGHRMTLTMVALYKLAMEQGTTRDIRAPYRKILLYGGIGSFTTVKKAIDNLVEEGYIKPVGQHDASRATAFRLTRPEAVRTCSTPPPHPGVQEHYTYAQVGHDAFQTKALGTMGLRILGLLEAHPGEWLSQSEVARRLGVASTSINRHVQPDRPLVTHGLIERDSIGRLRYATTPTTAVLDTVAFAMRTAGTTDRRRRAAVRYYQRTGWLTEDLHWIDQATGVPTNRRADWLAPRTTTTHAIRSDRRAGTTGQDVEDVA